MIFAYIFGGLSVVSFLMGVAAFNSNEPEFVRQIEVSIWFASALSNAFFAFVSWCLSQIVSFQGAAHSHNAKMLKLAEQNLERIRSHSPGIGSEDTNQKVVKAQENKTVLPTRKSHASGSSGLKVTGRIRPNADGTVSINTSEGDVSFKNMAAARKFLADKGAL